MRVRTSRGLRVDHYLWGSSLPGDRDVDVPGIDADGAIGVTFLHDDKIIDGSNPCSPKPASRETRNPRSYFKGGKATHGLL